MDAEKIREKVQELIIEGKLKDAAEEIIQYLDSGVMNKKDKALFQIYNQSIHQISQLNELNNAKLSGIIDHDDADRKRNQIRLALLDINSRIDNLGSKQNYTPSPSTTSTGDGGKKKNTGLYLIIAVLTAGLIGLATMFFSKKNQPPTETKAVKTERVDPPPTQEEGKTPGGKKPPRNLNQFENLKVENKNNSTYKELTGNSKIKTDKLIDNTKIVKLYFVEYASLSFDKIKSYKSKMRMSSIDGNKLKEGSILAYRTGTGRYGKMQIRKAGQDLTFAATTYDTSGEVKKSTLSKVIKGTYNCDLDEMEQKTSGTDFQWQIQSSAKRYLRPRDQAIFYQVK